MPKPASSLDELEALLKRFEDMAGNHRERVATLAREHRCSAYQINLAIMKAKSNRSYQYETVMVDGLSITRISPAYAAGIPMRPTARA